MDTTADRLLPRMTAADVPGRCFAPDTARRPTRQTMNRRTPHRVRPPPSQITADLSRSRARKPKAPAPHRPRPPAASPDGTVARPGPTAATPLHPRLDTQTPDTTQGRRADIAPRSVFRPQGARRPTRRHTKQRTPHRIRPPPPQATADLPRQRVREPKAPTLPDPAVRRLRVHPRRLCVTPRGRCTPPTIGNLIRRPCRPGPFEGRHGTSR